MSLLEQMDVLAVQRMMLRLALVQAIEAMKQAAACVKDCKHQGHFCPQLDLHIKNLQKTAKETEAPEWQRKKAP